MGDRPPQPRFQPGSYRDPHQWRRLEAAGAFLIVALMALFWLSQCQKPEVLPTEATVTPTMVPVMTETATSVPTVLLVATEAPTATQKPTMTTAPSMTPTALLSPSVKTTESPVATATPVRAPAQVPVQIPRQ